ncbi:hypothetical protein [Actinokineospora sp. NPDC004072]
MADDEAPADAPAEEAKPPDEAAREPADEGSAESQSRAAQENATSASSSEDWKRFSASIESGMRSLLGRQAGGTSNFFFGATSVDTIGDRIGQAAPAAPVRSGPVPAATLARIRDSFVAPPAFPALQRVLESHHVLIIHAPPGTGRTTTALRLLDQTCRAGVHKLDPDVQLKGLTAADLRGGPGFLLESLDPGQAAALRGFHADRLGRLLQERGGMLVVVVDRATRLPAAEIGHLVVADLGPVEPTALLAKHLEHTLGDAAEAAAVLDRPPVRQIIADLAPDTPCREVAELSGLLIELARDRIDADAVRRVRERTSDTSFAEWFDQQGTTDQRAFVIALAVFNNEAVQLVSEAATALAERIRLLEVPDPEARTRSLFDVPLHARLDAARAEVVTEIVEYRGAEVPEQRARFRDDSYATRVLAQVERYGEVYPVVLDWIRDLGAMTGQVVRSRAGLAAGMFARTDFIGVFERLIHPWACSGDFADCWAAAAALRMAGEHPTYERIVVGLLSRWVRHHEDPELRAAAARALGTTTALSTARVLSLLKVATRNATPELGLIIGESVSALMLDPAAQDPVLRALVNWIHDAREPQRRWTAMIAVLLLSYRFKVVVAESGEPWPALLWLAEHQPEHRPQIVVLLGKVLQAAAFLHSGYAEVMRWVRLAYRDPTLRAPVGSLLGAVAAEMGETATIEHYIGEWAARHPARAEPAAEILSHLDRKER